MKLIDGRDTTNNWTHGPYIDILLLGTDPPVDAWGDTGTSVKITLNDLVYVLVSLKTENCDTWD